MGVRIGVLAARSESVEPLRKAFVQIPPASVHVDRGWAYAKVKLDEQPDLFGPTADAALAALDTAALQVWIDGDSWFLSLHRPGGEPARYAQQRGYLDEKYDDPSAGLDGVTLSEFIDEHERDLPDGWPPLGPAPDGPLSRLRPFVFERASALCDALELAGVPHDRDIISGALTGHHVTPAEAEWGVMNLPRFLEAIDLHDIFPDWRIALAQAESAREIALQQAEQAAAEAAERDRPIDYIATLVGVLGDAPPAELDRPVDTSPAVLWLLPWACHVHVAVGVIVAPCKPGAIVLPQRDEVSVVQHDDALHLGFTFDSVWEAATIMTELAGALATLPNGTAIELLTVSMPDDDTLDDDPPTAGNMRFRGTIEAGRWRISHCDPAASADDLERALAVFAWCDEHTPFQATDASEATAILALAAQTYWFHDDDVPRAKGAAIEVTDLYRPHLAMMAFRHRLADGPWDTETGKRRDANELAGWEELTGGSL